MIFKNWYNYVTAWRIDRIKQLASFSFQSMHDLAFKQAWALDNLRPFSAEQPFMTALGVTRHTSEDS